MLPEDEAQKDAKVFQLTKQEVIIELGSIKSLLMLNKIGKLQIQHRKDRKNILDMTELGITRLDAADIILSLDVENYHGTVYDDAFPGDDKERLHIFGYDYKGAENIVELYIKSKIKRRGGDLDFVLAISFHKSMFPLTYPYGK